MIARLLVHTPLLALAILLGGAAAPMPDRPSTPGDILAAAPPEAWAEIKADELLVLTLSDGGRVVLQIAPRFAPTHVSNIVRLARAGFWDGTSINRVQDNYVVQWGDASERKTLPPGLAATDDRDYVFPLAASGFRPLPFRDAYAEQAGHVSGGWPAARAGDKGWLVHCYGMVGVGRGAAPDAGTGAELYTVIGHAPRHLDRNIQLVGRVIDGIERLSALPRGSEALGFYATAAERRPIASIRMATDLPASDRPRFQLLRTDTPTFTAWLNARANRKDDFFVRPAGAVDICNAQPPIRPIK